MAIPGIILTIFATAAFGLANGSQFQWLALWFIFGIVAVSIKSTVWTAAVLGVFEKSRGLALGLTLDRLRAGRPADLQPANLSEMGSARPL